MNWIELNGNWNIASCSNAYFFPLSNRDDRNNYLWCIINYYFTVLRIVTLIVLLTEDTIHYIYYTNATLRMKLHLSVFLSSTRPRTLKRINHAFTYVRYVLFYKQEWVNFNYVITGTEMILATGTTFEHSERRYTIHSVSILCYITLTFDSISR